MPATIKDVAIMANTSIATVSKVLNNKPIRVSDAKRKEILVAIEELNYIPNSVASGLKRGAKNTIAIAMPDLSDPSDCRQSPTLLCGIFLRQLPESSVFMRTFRRFSGIMEASN